ncbi:hypothetical protein MUU72_29220 [Streptomyces sp. RS10V-4]|uniref:solute carrier family 23 protein n=1 Tax=Streptomyces rhizoryzae TaxID=2932493 RepID=UPI002005D059|nr:solute carrier family 23 protein [Streptomyces rhizoryzae]MCK7627128.1 hypothetical protein [Streptomyces rhizoryzae]
MTLTPRRTARRRPRPVRPDGARGPGAGRTLGLGVQHALVMYAGAIAVPLMFGAGAGLDTEDVSVLVNADLFVAGLVTVVQSLGAGRFLGVRRPLVTGGSFVCVTPMIMIAREYGMLPVVAPRIYHRFPEWWQLLFGSPSTAALVVALGLHLAFRRGRTGVAPEQAAGRTGLPAP